MVYLAVVAVTLAGLLIAILGPWRRGVMVLGIAILLAAAARGVLSDAEAGMLRVRRRITDMVMLAVVGVALIVLANVIPDQLV